MEDVIKPINRTIKELNSTYKIRATNEYLPICGCCYLVLFRNLLIINKNLCNK